MKYLLISIILFNLFNTEKIIESNKTNDIIVTIINKETNEKLVGVKNFTNNTYSNFDGKMIIQKNTIANLNLISYENNQILIKNDTIIKLIKIK